MKDFKEPSWDCNTSYPLKKKKKPYWEKQLWFKEELKIKL